MKLNNPFDYEFNFDKLLAQFFFTMYNKITVINYTCDFRSSYN
jgi:hypothetical protein